MIICSCFGINEDELNKIIEDGAESIEDVAEKCYASMGCGACKEQIQLMLDEKNNLDGYK